MEKKIWENNTCKQLRGRRGKRIVKGTKKVMGKEGEKLHVSNWGGR